LRSDAHEGGLRAIDVAFCSAAVGCGHTRAGVAIHDALRARGQLGEATFVEALDHAPGWFARTYRDGYLRAVRHLPRLVGAIYDRTDVPRRDRRALAPILDRSEDAVLRAFRAHPALRSADAVVSTHFLTTAVLGRMRLRGELRAPVVTVVTDEHPHAVWLHPGIDLTCVASDAAYTSAIEGGLDPDRVAVTGIPVDPRFCMATSVAGADADRASRPIVLACGGGQGLGDLADAVAAIVAARVPCTVVAVAGRNAVLEATLRRLAASARGVTEVRVLGYTNAMHALMAGADLMVGKPGGLTTTEARAMSLPMVLLRPIPGQEERNARMLEHHGAAVRLARAADAGTAVASILADPARLRSMRAACGAIGRPRAAFDVARRIAETAATVVAGPGSRPGWRRSPF
jgi:processive 1,2-diacylglycerol beta-glucosyltransferase